MDAKAVEASSQPPPIVSEQYSQHPPGVPEQATSDSSASQTKSLGQESPPLLSASGITSWARNLKLPQPLANPQENSGFSALSRFATGIKSHLPSATSTTKDGAQTPSGQSGVLETLTKGFVDSSRGAVKAVQVKARHMVSQNKRRYQGFYRNHMEEVIRFFETHHPGNYKVYNLCSERLYDASLFKGKVAHFPFDDHNCPPIQLILSFCQSACSWLKEDIQNVVVVHCKAGMARTGLMICSLLLYLKFFPTAEEAMSYYNEKRCVDAKALVLPSQIRYVRYFENILMNFKGETPPGRRCMLRGFKLHNCPYWIRPSITISNHNGVLFTTKKHPKTKDLMPEDFWIRSAKKGIVIFALPGEPGLTELAGDFKLCFHERQGDFYCWLNTTMMENKITLSSSDLDGFDKRKLPSPGFQLEIVMVDYKESLHAKPKTEGRKPENSSDHNYTSGSRDPSNTNAKKASGNEEDDVFSDSEGEDGSPKSRHTQTTNNGDEPKATGPASEEFAKQEVSTGSKESAQQNDSGKADPSIANISKPDSGGNSEFKVVAADASVFTFGDEEDYESE
ncbi:phosphatidylinositol 3,4,5-trisphosphate 3-phosphatase and protein-tyrosine-phosphatase PTEN2A-like isoform X2 [Punica granatum]|uniref:Phosphatidylinositol 3,4,5-trisphosphate 3-phosphatase and protein-tyrosine-phosphatase PTEN2A-like isoform X2 n=1 Tax=Punica granatum TaxID=22663 RepID=A0A6P8DZG3_PUNGR|nr:phosphatidylinositol 3,4,5-trisphosphate 3-phosphatase and protein-tyrosine-phosphatase PTEN2A-like isoform X2 [Punica granatum]